MDNTRDPLLSRNKGPCTENGSRVVFVECADVPLGRKADAFFAFFVLNNRLMSVHRRFNLELPEVARNPGKYFSMIMLTRYECSGGSIRAVDESALCVGEDPRVVSDGLRAYVLCRGGWTENEQEPESYKLVLLPERSELRIRLPSGLDVGKNWQPFLKRGQLFALQSFAPTTILRIDETGEAEIAHQEPSQFWIPAPHDGYTMARGGSNAVNADDLLIGLGHLTVQRHDHRPFFWTLDQSMRMNVIIPSFFLGLREKGFNIVDPTSLFIFKDRVHLGISASERDWFYGQRFLNLLVELPFGDGTSLVRSGESPLFADLGQSDLAGLDNTRTFIPANMPRQIEADTRDGAVKSLGEAGCLVHGPYQPIERAGTLVASLTYRTFEEPLDAPGRFDVSAFTGSVCEILAECPLRATQGTVETTALAFSTKCHVGSLLETRVVVEKGAKLEVLGIRVTEKSDVGNAEDNRFLVGSGA